MPKSTRKVEILNPPSGLKLSLPDGSRTKSPQEYYQIRALLKGDKITYSERQFLRKHYNDNTIGKWEAKELHRLIKIYGVEKVDSP